MQECPSREANPLLHDLLQKSAAMVRDTQLLLGVACDPLASWLPTLKHP